MGLKIIPMLSHLQNVYPKAIIWFRNYGMGRNGRNGAYGSNLQIYARNGADPGVRREKCTFNFIYTFIYCLPKILKSSFNFSKPYAFFIYRPFKIKKFGSMAGHI